MKYFNQKMRRRISTALIAAMTVSNTVTVSAAPFEGGYQKEVELIDDRALSEEFTQNHTASKVITDEQVTLVRGETAEILKPEGFSENITWSTKFLKHDGTYLRNAGFSKIKRELKEGERDGDRLPGDTTADHLLTVEKTAEGNGKITAKHKGELVVVASDDQGNTKQWSVTIKHVDPSELPEVNPEDYARIRSNWKKSLIGSNLLNEDGGAEILETMNQEAQEIWDAYVYKEGDVCEGIPWKEDEGAKGNKNIPYEDDAVEFRPSFKKVLSMAKAYAAEGGALYKNEALLKDMTEILDFLCGKCYVPKTQTDNWWTWEIGLPKDLIPALIMICDDLPKEKIMEYTKALYFFQPDPFYEGAINIASTHGKGYRKAQGANIIDCSTTAVGLGALREDNELVYLGIEASSQTFVIQEIEDSAQISKKGYKSGFYPDGSYLDHISVPYLGAYGIEFMKGGVRIPALTAGTPWKYSEAVQKNLEYYIVEGFGNGMYQGMMLDCLKGRSVSRPQGNNKAAGREAMVIILQMVDSLSEQAKAQTMSALKCWMEEDPEFIDTLKGAENVPIKQKALEILEDSSIEAYVPAMHKSYPLMDRAIHRTDDYLFALSMYSERIQNSEIMNHENRLGWHQSNGMTYIYDRDKQYTNDFWNTVNPLRLPGTTVVPVNIGTGKPDSSGYAQGGDFLGTESWVGGTSIGDYGISGMAFTGKNRGIAGDASVTYAPNLKGKKSWFMFGNEIVCLGADISNQGINLPVETIVENRKLSADGSNAFVVDGKRTDLPVKEANIKELVDRTADVSGTAYENVTWAHVEGTEASGTGFYFPMDGTEIQARHGRTTGDWADVGTFNGESTQDYLELWIDHGVNPENASYSYVLLPESTQEETAAYAASPEITVLENNGKVQAVHHKGLNMTGVNFWSENGGTMNDVSSSGAASVMLQETEDGMLTLAVSDPTMKNKGTIQITVNKPVEAAGQLDENVTFEQKEDGAVLTFAMEGTNGASCMAELKLQASVAPAAVQLAKGESQQFEIRDYGMNIQNVTWSVEGADKELAKDTVIDENGLLKISEDEENKALAVIAVTDSGAIFRSYVSLGSTASVEIPEELQDLKAVIKKALEEAEKNGPDSEEARSAVKEAVEAIAKADDKALIHSMMDEILEISQLYQEAFAGTDEEVGEMVIVTEQAAELEPVEASGMCLSILPSDVAAGASKAVLVLGEKATASNAEIFSEDILDEDEILLTEDELATPSDALPAEKATPSDAEESEDESSDEEEKKLDKISGKKLDLDHYYSFYADLIQELEDGSRMKLKQQAPIRLEVSLPESVEADRTILAAVVDENGSAKPVSFKLDGDRMILILAETGKVVVANTESSVPETMYQITIDEDIKGGRVTSNYLEAPAGTEVTLTAEADRKYRLKALWVNGENVKTSSNGTYTFILNEDVEVTAEFRRKSSGGSGSGSVHGSVSTSGPGVASAGWQQLGARWKYRNADGSHPSNCWSLIQNVWYCFDAEGYMRTGWYFEPADSHWYYLLPNGAMATGWHQIDGKWYFLNDITRGVTGWTYKQSQWVLDKMENPGMPQGALYQSGVTPDGYQVDDKGVYVQK